MARLRSLFDPHQYNAFQLERVLAAHGLPFRVSDVRQADGRVAFLLEELFDTTPAECLRHIRAIRPEMCAALGKVVGVKKWTREDNGIEEVFLWYR